MFIAKGDTLINLFPFHNIIITDENIVSGTINPETIYVIENWEETQNRNGNVKICNIYIKEASVIEINEEELNVEEEQKKVIDQ